MNIHTTEPTSIVVIHVMAEADIFHGFCGQSHSAHYCVTFPVIQTKVRYSLGITQRMHFPRVKVRYVVLLGADRPAGRIREKHRIIFCNLIGGWRCSVPTCLLKKAKSCVFCWQHVEGQMGSHLWGNFPHLQGKKGFGFHCIKDCR